ncbi:glycosyltransferase family 39 protein, partial [Myxococcota bacterium]|nr:glycosyltransferase family 39 protein [Myxococcota bacterium]
MNEQHCRARETTLLWSTAIVFLVVCAVLLLPQIDRLGLYYDEAFIAQQARDFLEPGRESLHPGSVRSVELFGRPFPVRNAAYLGSLKSQLLIPAFWIGGATVETLRIATFAVAVLALLLTLFWARRIFSLPVALVGGVLVATDPSFLFFGRFEWGPFTTNFLCRAAGLLFLTWAWQSSTPARRRMAALAGGISLGLGIYSRADFALIIAAGGLGLLVGHLPLVREIIRTRKTEALLAGGGLLIASLPMWSSALSLITVSGSISDRGDFFDRLAVLWNVLDGTQFRRVIESGGLFDQASLLSLHGGLLGFALIGSVMLVGLQLITESRLSPETASRDPRRWLWITTVMTLLATLALPGAIRAHHHLNALPFVQILIACGFEVVWRSAKRTHRIWAQSLVILALCAVIASQLFIVVGTEKEISRSSGLGRWSPTLTVLAEELDAVSGAEAVSLDWGFHEPLLFLTRDLPLQEAIWSIPQSFAAGRPWVHEGDGNTHYLIHAPPYDVFGLSEPLLGFARELPPSQVSVRPWSSRGGQVDFYSIRFLQPHRLSYVGAGRFQM